MDRIECVRLQHVRVGLWEPFRISNGVIADKDAILVELVCDGLAGMGEASPMAGSFYSPETPESSWAVLTDELIPLLKRLPAHTAAEFNTAASGVSDCFARCGIETALWDLEAKRKGIALAQLLGGSPDKAVESGLAVGLADSIDQLLDAIAAHMERGGYRRLKIKVMPGWDVEPLAAVRKRFGDIPLFVDANCAYGIEHADHIATWDAFGLMMIEQPLPRKDLAGHAALAERIKTPVCLDEGAESPAAVREAIRIGACSIINIKLQRVGGFGPALEILKDARAAGIGVWMGTMPELAVGGWQAVHFGTLDGVCYPTDVEASERWFKCDVTVPPLRVQDGLIKLPSGDGIAVQWDEEVKSKCLVREEEIRI